MVNDETGISDPRELIVDKGRAFIPQGKDVLLPLSRVQGVHSVTNQGDNERYGYTALRNRKRQFGRVYISQGRLDALHQNARSNDRTRT